MEYAIFVFLIVIAYLLFLIHTRLVQLVVRSQAPVVVQKTKSPSLPSVSVERKARAMMDDEMEAMIAQKRREHGKALLEALVHDEP